jgi:hypothetical protein
LSNVKIHLLIKFDQVKSRWLIFKRFLYTGCPKKNGPGYNFAIDNSNEKNYTGNEMTKNTTNLSEHIIFIPSTHLWAMGNFYFSNSNGIKNYTL